MTGHEHEISMRIASEIRKRRLTCGLTQKKLADAIDVERAHVSRVESGRHIPTILTLCDYAKALGCKVSDLLSNV